MTAFVFDSDMAQKYGINGAIMIYCMQSWIAKNKASNKHFYDGHYWMYNSVDAFTKLLPFFSAKQVRSMLDKLIAKGVLITKNYNTKKYDKTLWYAFADEEKFLEEENKNPLPSEENPFAQMGEPIPDNNTVNIKKEKEINKERKESPQRGPSDDSVTDKELFDFWNREFLPGRENVAGIQMFSATRKQKFNSLLKFICKDQQLKTYHEAFEFFKEQILSAYDNSLFLQGKAKGYEGFKLDFDFCINQTKFTNIVEGRYEH